MSEKLTLSEIMQETVTLFNENPAPISGVNLTCQFNITGKEEKSFQLQIQDGAAKVMEQSDIRADCLLIMSFENFRRFLIGKLNGTTAFMTGKLKIKGDITKAIKLETILKQYNLNEVLQGSR
ncbi:SCP2 sterol-binding domain-containing protein [Peribacillus sp. SCS-155]|uniref:SCP2 sterol-binding domain-containing protein n=1 Tax=Peribacillus sedimenti TaxID=3115297 RepID=UPI0039057E58